MMKAAFIATALLTASSISAIAQEDAGKSEYMVACAVCHGESGMGDGPFAEVMNLGVPGLTKLSAENEGVFPFLKTLMIVDGRTGVRGHGGTMPIWGDRFKSAAVETAGKYGAETIARGRLLSLVYYLESIQEK